MFIRCLSNFTLLAVLASFVASCASQEHPYLAGDQFLTNVTVIDVIDGREIPDQTIVIRNERILEIVSTSQIALPASATVLATEGYVVPGLWDMHVHSLSDPDIALDYFFPLFIANGITGIRDMGSVVDGIVETRSRLAGDTSLLGPHLYVSGPLLDGRKLPWYGDLPLVLKNAEEVNRELPKLKAAGMDFFKVYSSLSPDAYQAVIEFGAEHNIPVAGHAPDGIDLTGAARAGQRTVEHLPSSGFRDCLSEPDMWFQRLINAKFGQGMQTYYEITDQMFDQLDYNACQRAFEAMAAAGTRFTPTLALELNDRSRVPASDVVYKQPDGREWCEAGLAEIDKVDPELREAVYKRYGDLLTQMREAGVVIIAGSDISNGCLVPGFSLHWELERLGEVGFTPLEALQSATLHAVDVMDRGNDYGQVATGYYADIVVLEANPLEDISHLRSIRGVMTQGRWIDEQERSAMMNSVREYLAAQENAAKQPS